MGLFRKRARLRVLGERECYLRLHGIRTGEIAIVRAEPEQRPDRLPEPDGPTEDSPALHLMMRYPRDPDPSRMLKDLQRLMKFARPG